MKTVLSRRAFLSKLAATIPLATAASAAVLAPWMPADPVLVPSPLEARAAEIIAELRSRGWVFVPWFDRKTGTPLSWRDSAVGLVGLGHADPLHPDTRPDEVCKRLYREMTGNPDLFTEIRRLVCAEHGVFG